MFNLIKQIFNDENRRVRTKVVGIYIFLALANLVLWGIAIRLSTIIRSCWAHPSSRIVLAFAMRSMPTISPQSIM